MKLKLNKFDVWTYIKNFILVVLGTGVLAFGTAVFLVPYELVTGGVSGIAIVLDAFSHDVLGCTFGEDFYITVLTWALFFLGWIICFL